LEIIFLHPGFPDKSTGDGSGAQLIIDFDFISLIYFPSVEKYRILWTK
jgi:hypothetical protein